MAETMRELLFRIDRNRRMITTYMALASQYGCDTNWNKISALEEEITELENKVRGLMLIDIA